MNRTPPSRHSGTVHWVWYDGASTTHDNGKAYRVKRIAEFRVTAPSLDLLDPRAEDVLQAAFKDWPDGEVLVAPDGPSEPATRRADNGVVASWSQNYTITWEDGSE